MATGQLAAGDLTIAIGFGAAAAIVVAIATVVVGLVIEAARGGDDVVRDVQCFIELSAAAHASLPDGPLLSNPHGETSAAIDRMLAKKEQARRALWGSRDAIRPERRANRDSEPVPHMSATTRTQHFDLTRREQRWEQAESGPRGA